MFSHGACDENERDLRRSEAAAIDHAVSELREAENEEKSARLLALENQACSAPQLCQLRDLCLEAYRAQVSAIERIQRVRRMLDASAEHDAGKANTGAALELRKAETELAAARDGGERCADLQGSLELRFGLR